MSGNIDVLIIAHNEALNLGHCLESLQGWVRKIHVIDSGSTDGTQELAKSMGAEVFGLHGAILETLAADKNANRFGLMGRCLLNL